MTFTAKDAQFITKNSQDCANGKLKEQYDDIIEKIKLAAVNCNYLNIHKYVDINIRNKLTKDGFSVVQTDDARNETCCCISW